MLRKIEERLLYFIAARDYIQAGAKKKELEKREQELHAQRKDDRMKRKKALEEAVIQER